ncbi:L-lactate dehydrogenase [Candidatus Phytoplasma sp. AldY-WA1]|jgi:L-lactate dehydrogenase|uniref:L-lactate dehydrogenase n=1 Tax=Candidatus Phytoplasma sp. AldY-WA1 TaxID=2852100 RepID=UPI001CE23D6F|nr:L-lactate dehydrogenase [Candidatus Phytoplasma sp. AldY-WA1]
MKQNKITIIGGGNVGSAIGLILSLNKIVSEIVILDVNPIKAQGEATDISQGVNSLHPIKITATSDYKDTKDSDIVIITASIPSKNLNNRLDLIKSNLTLFQKIITPITLYSPKTFLLIVSNPCDILTYIAYKLSGFPSHRVLGSGTTLDTARLKFLLSQEMNIDARDIDGNIIGEHGDSQIVTWSCLNVHGVSFEENFKKLLSKKTLEKHEINDFKEMIANKVQKSAYEIISQKGYTNYGIAISVLNIVEAIIKDEKKVLNTSSYLQGEYNIEDIYLGVPSVIGKSGVEKILEISLNDKEKEQLLSSAKLLKGIIDESIL